jgi:hypothetical protein
LQEKDEAEKKVERVQQAIQKIYREILEIPMVIEATIKEHIYNISEVIKEFCNNIGELEARTTPGRPTEEKEQRDRTSITSVAIIKILGEECVRLCE